MESIAWYNLKDSQWQHFLGAAIGLTLFLFFIDEGFYDFRWLSDPGNWIAFAIYVTAAFLGQLTFYYVIFPNIRMRYRVWLSLIIGSISGAISLVLILSS